MVFLNSHIAHGDVLGCFLLVAEVHEDFVCYPLVTALSSGSSMPKQAKTSQFSTHKADLPRSTPIALALRRAKRQCDAALCNLQYRSLKDIRTTAEKLRWLRCQRNLYQTEVADYAGLERSTYIGYEEGERDSYPPDKLAKIAELFGGLQKICWTSTTRF